MSAETIQHSYPPGESYRLIPPDWEDTVTVQRPGRVVFHHPCHLDCPAEDRRCMHDHEVWPCEVARMVDVQ